MKAFTKDSLSTIATQAIDAKSKGDHLTLYRLTEMIIRHPHLSDTKELLIDALTIGTDKDPGTYIDLLKKLDSELH